MADTVKVNADFEEAILAGGCFWGMQELFRTLPGIVSSEVGYIGGHSPAPDYHAVCAGNTGHAEAVRLIFDPSATSYEQILEFFFSIHDPTTVDRQGNDIGSQYRSAIFYLDDSQLRSAHRIMEQMHRRWSAPIVTRLERAKDFTPAEQEHQDYLQKHPGGYNCHYIRSFDE